MKKLFSFVLASVLIVSCIFPASAAQVETVANSGVCDLYSNEAIQDVHQQEILDGTQRSTSKPTQYWDLGSKSYNATLKQVGNSYLFTNYYFHCNSDGEIYTRVKAEAQGLGQLRVGIYNLTDKKDDAHWTYEIDATGIDETVRFYNLDNNDHYAVYFSSVYNGYNVVYITGTATVYN